MPADTLVTSSRTRNRSRCESGASSGAQGSEHGLRLSRFLADARIKLRDRVKQFSRFIEGEYRRDLLVGREIAGPMGRSALVRDSTTGDVRPMLMFGSNNYLGLANDPQVLTGVREGLSRYGAGVAGPPMLNGTTSLHRELQRRLSRLKCAEDALIYSSGYSANIGWVSGLVGRRDVVVLDRLCHASAFDGLRLTKARVVTFRHNDVTDFEAKLAKVASREDFVNIFVVVEGVYSMDGDLAPLDLIVPLSRRFGAFLVVDDAHGTGVLGENGRGAAEHFGVEGRVDLVMGTFSKALAVTGGFLAGSKEVIEYLRFFSRSYFFSASLPPTTAAAVLAGLDVIEQEPERRQELHENVRYLVQELRSRGIETESSSAIVPVRVPRGIRRVACRLDDAGIFVNAIEYPAVPKGKERLRVSVTSEHTRQDIDRLVDALTAALEEENVPSVEPPR